MLDPEFWPGQDTNTHHELFDAHRKCSHRFVMGLTIQQRLPTVKLCDHQEQ